MRVGIGYDIHRFDAARALVLGGVTIAGAPGLAGHSDADVLLHAIVDALLGAAALGDIGTHFPDSDPQWANADSARLLELTLGLVREAGYAPANVDATVIAEAPRLAPHIAAMRARIAVLTGLPVDAVSVKAKTNEGLGEIGRGEAVAALAVASLQPLE
jgi:2-C-methyl-D-erythritol 2,4-cyclodiphosphate synthase